jgi:periplasmic protein TonB
MKIAALLLTVLLSLPASADPITSGSPLDDGVAHFGRMHDPKPVFRERPEYPEGAIKRKIEGYVDINFTIKPDGSVGEPKVVYEVPRDYGFAAAAMRAFVQWKFQPNIVEGTAIATPATYRFTFKLDS